MHLMNRLQVLNFRFVQEGTLIAATWCFKLFLPIVIRPAEQILLSAPDRANLILCHCCYFPLLPCPLTCFPPQSALLFLSCWQKKGRRAGSKRIRGCLRKRHLFPFDSVEGSIVTMWEDRVVGGKSWPSSSVCLLLVIIAALYSFEQLNLDY